jgi:hypothetical protein
MICASQTVLTPYSACALEVAKWAIIKDVDGKLMDFF